MSLQSIPARIWAVITGEGHLTHTSVTKTEANETINDAVGLYEIEGAAQWVLREYAPVRESYQKRLDAWMAVTFADDVCKDTTERGHRFGEEAVELLQANGITKEDVLKLVEHVYSRPVGEFGQEVGGTLVTLAAMCTTRGVDMMGEAEKELARVWQPDVMARIQAKQAAKRAMLSHSPLPGSAA